jgi:hypothetical protein
VKDEEINPLPYDVIGLGVNQLLEVALFGRLQRWATRLLHELNLCDLPIHEDDLRTSFSAL